MIDSLKTPGGPLKMAVPRGALLDEILDLLDRIGIVMSVRSASSSPRSSRKRYAGATSSPRSTTSAYSIVGVRTSL